MTDYVLAWLIYLVAAVGLLFLFWRLTKILPWRTLRDLLRVLVATVILTPVVVDANTLHIAPISVSMVVEFITDKKEAAIGHGVIVAVAWLLLSVLVLVSNRVLLRRT